MKQIKIINGRKNFLYVKMEIDNKIKPKLNYKKRRITFIRPKERGVNIR